LGWQAVRISIDTNVLLRVVVGDDPAQERVAKKLLKKAELIAVPLSSLVEFVWVLRSGYGYNRTEILEALEAMLLIENLVVDQMAVYAGIGMMRAGGDFADGVIAFEGERLGGETFASFDVKAANAWAKLGRPAQLLS
jgi:predicted nucleic-acid-binding protein